MEIADYFQLTEPARQFVLAQIREAEWAGARFLHDLLTRHRLAEYSGDDVQLLLLMDGEKLVSFCTLSSQDEIRGTELKPWIGFVYTAPAFRGQRCSQKLIAHACNLAKAQGYAQLYVSSNEHGFYENYGFQQFSEMPNVWGERTQVFVRKL